MIRPFLHIMTDSLLAPRRESLYNNTMSNENLVFRPFRQARGLGDRGMNKARGLGQRCQISQPPVRHTAK